jgi:hypothetical protein
MTNRGFLHHIFIEQCCIKKYGNTDRKKYLQDRIFISVLSGNTQINHDIVLVISDHLVEVLGQLGGELLVPERAALDIEDVGDGGDQQ